MLKKIGLGLLLIWIAAFFFQPKIENAEVKSNENINAPEIASILKKACYDCHSNEANSPWYSAVPPVSYWLVNHVKEGKEELNFSLWQTFTEKRQDKKRREIIEMLEEKEMPLESYLIMHEEAKLTDEEIAKIIDWAKAK